MPPIGYPIVLSVAGQSCLVVGGGRVALGKVDGLLRAGADVTVVAPDVIGEIAALDITLERRRYRSDDIAGRFIAIAATGDPAVDGAISSDGERAGVLVNVADNPARCAFTLPAVTRRGPVVVAVSTGGASPALATWLRNRLDRALPPDLDELIERIADARARIRRAGTATEGLAWHDLIDTVADGLALSDGTAEATIDTFVDAATGGRVADRADHRGTVS